MNERIGFTGTREGMSLRQREQLRAIIQSWHPFEFHHGQAIGADTHAEDVVRAWSPLTQVIAHPAGADPLKRNRDIVDAVDVLIAAPRADAEELRSGTWATVRYARKRRIPIVFLAR